MARITSLLKQFNESTRYVGEFDRLINFLDEHAPEWRTIIKDSEEWLPLFRQDVKVFPNRKPRLAAIFFDIIDHQEALLAVWNDEQCCDHYRLTAIRRLREIDETIYLPQYIDWFKNAKLDIYELGKELFDFNGALDVALNLVTSPRLKYHDEELGMVYLAAKANL